LIYYCYHLQVARVCKRWQRLTNDPVLWVTQAAHWSTSLPGTPARTPATAARPRLDLTGPALQRAREELERAVGAGRIGVQLQLHSPPREIKSRGSVT